MDGVLEVVAKLVGLALEHDLVAHAPVGGVQLGDLSVVVCGVKVRDSRAVVHCIGYYNLKDVTIVDF